MSSEGRVAGHAPGNDERIRAIKIGPFDVRGQVNARETHRVFLVHITEQLDVLGLRQFTRGKQLARTAVVEFARVPHLRAGQQAHANEVRAAGNGDAQAGTPRRCAPD